MGQYFKDTEQLYKVFGALFEKAKHDPRVGPKLAKAGIIIKFNYTDPEGSITINLKDKPQEEGTYVSYEFGESKWEPDVTMTQSADFSHRFWYGKENAIAALVMRKIIAKGAIPKALALIPAIRPLHRLYPKILEELGMNELIINE